MAIFKAIEENTPPTEPVARGAPTTRYALGFWPATWSRGFMTLETAAPALESRIRPQFGQRTLLGLPVGGLLSPAALQG